MPHIGELYVQVRKGSYVCSVAEDLLDWIRALHFSIKRWTAMDCASSSAWMSSMVAVTDWDQAMVGQEEGRGRSKVEGQEGSVLTMKGKSGERAHDQLLGHPGTARPRQRTYIRMETSKYRPILGPITTCHCQATQHRPSRRSPRAAAAAEGTLTEDPPF